MLIVSRKKNEGIVINGDTEIIIVDIQGDKVRVGINAPEEVRIVRRELLETEVLNRAAAQVKAKPDINKLKALEDLLKRKK